MKTFLKIATVCLPMLVLSPLAFTPAQSQVSFGAEIHIGDGDVLPPPPPREVIVERPYPEAIWVPGYYNPYHVWAPGYWRHPHYAERGYYGRGFERRGFEGREYAHRDFDRGRSGREQMEQRGNHEQNRGGHDQGGGGHEQGGSGRGRMR